MPLLARPAGKGAPRANPAGPPAAPLSIGDLGTMMVAFALPLTRLREVELIGVLFIHDLLAPLVLLVLLMRPQTWPLLKPLKPFLLLIGLWLASQIVTDFYRGTPFVDYSRGWSRIGLLAINTTAYWLLAGGRLRILAVAAFSIGITSILNVYMNPSSLHDVDPWKFGIGGGLALMAASLSMSSSLRRWFGPAMPALLLLAVGLVSLALNVRALFAICTLAAVYSLFAFWAAKRPNISRRITPAVFFLMIVGGAAVGQGLITAYADLAERGVLGHDARIKYLEQRGSGGNIILGGRSTLLVAQEAIKDSPIIGHGSWAHNPYYVQLYFMKLKEYGLPVPETYQQLGQVDEFLIPTHSHFFGAWVEGGILSTLFWGWVLFLAFTALYAVLKRQEQPNVLVAYMALTLFWDIPFSPFASDQRIIEALEICVLIAAASALKFGTERVSAQGIANIRHNRALARVAGRSVSREGTSPQA